MELHSGSAVKLCHSRISIVLQNASMEPHSGSAVKLVVLQSTVRGACFNGAALWERGETPETRLLVFHMRSSSFNGAALWERGETGLVSWAVQNFVTASMEPHSGSAVKLYSGRGLLIAFSRFNGAALWERGETLFA